MASKLSHTVLILLTTSALTGCVIKPNPIKTAAHADRAQKDIENLYRNVAPMEKPLELSEAVARGLLYNYDYKMGLMEEVLQGKQLTLANFNLLPRLAANAGYNHRSSVRATRSINFETELQSLPHSYSEERHSQTADIGFSWNLLDFGLGYYQAKQQSDRVLAAVEKRRRVMNNMVKEIQTSYWKALTAQRLLPEVENTISDINIALEKSKKIEKQKLQSPESTLEYRRDLLQLMTQLKQLRSDLYISKAQLGSLVNIKPGTPFSLAEPEARMYKLPAIGRDINKLQEYSLVFRPELREEAYQERIDRQNIKKEIIRVFPGVSILGSENFDANKYLKFQGWTEVGTRATWNLINVLQAPTAIKNAKTQVEIDEMRRLALTAAVLAQVTISYGEYQQAVEAYNTASELSMIEKKMLKIASDRTQSNTGSDLAVIRNKAQAISADLTKDNALANAKGALANLVTSVGIDVVPADTGEENLIDMTAIVSDAITRIDSGDLDRLMSASENTVVRVKPENTPASITEDMQTEGVEGKHYFKSFYDLLKGSKLATVSND
jgi:outer membrane protein TolC